MQDKPDSVTYHSAWWWAFGLTIVAAGLFFPIFIWAGLYKQASLDENQRDGGRGFIRGAIIGSILLFVLGIFCFIMMFGWLSVAIPLAIANRKPSVQNIAEKPISSTGLQNEIPLKFKVSSLVQKSQFHVELSCKLTNPDQAHVKNVAVHVSLLDADGKMLGVAKPMFAFVRPGESKVQTAVVLNVQAQDVRNYEISLDAVLSSKGMRADDQYTIVFDDAK